MSIEPLPASGATPKQPSGRIDIPSIPPVVPSKPQPSDLGAWSQSNVQCPSCFLLVRKDSLPKHMRRAHPQSTKSQPANAHPNVPKAASSPATTHLLRAPEYDRFAVMASGVVEGLISPPSVTVINHRDDTIIRHHKKQKKRHKKSTQGQPYISVPTRTNQPKRHKQSPPRHGGHGSAREAVGYFAVGYKSERGPDSTHEIGYFARENGRFGSAPSYDPMDDESGA